MRCLCAAAQSRHRSLSFLSAAEPCATVARGASLWYALATPGTPAGVRDKITATPSPASAEAALRIASHQTLIASGNRRPMLRSESHAAYTTLAARAAYDAGPCAV
jgi:hypothetical protein